MILVKVRGGLGNQMFQYALGRRLAIERGTRLELDLSWYGKRLGRGGARPFALDRFRIHASRAHRWELPYSGTSALRRLAHRRGSDLIPVKEEGLAFDPRFLESPDQSYLVGSWESHRYFADMSETIRDDFTFRRPPVGANAEVLDDIEGTESVSVHVRRGDLLVDGTARGGLLPPSYYAEAVERLAGMLSEPAFFVFSDDVAWCKDNLGLPFPARFVEHNGEASGTEDLRLMGCCKHSIIANSSFSWWGAWLHDHPAKRVCAPRRFHKDASVPREDLYPSHWTVLDTS